VLERAGGDLRDRSAEQRAGNRITRVVDTGVHA
jgi:hypothetical protein